MWLAGLPQLGLLLAALLQAVAASSRQRQAAWAPWTPLADEKYYYEADEAAPALQAGRTRKIAIIGAGPSGTSAAYYLKRAQDRLASGNFSATTEALDITIYERENRIGGRVAVVYPYDDDTHEPIELGASIFADVNLNLRRAVKQFALETGAHMGMDGQMGIWDGQQFLFEGDQSSWWTSAKFFLRYGYSAITTESVVKKQLAAFGALYRPSFLHARGQAKRDADATASGYPWTSIERLADAVNASALAATTGMQFFKERRVSELFIEEMVEAATRVNYAQDTDQIHGFGALVSLAASGATGVKKGNYRIFEEFARRSGARLLTGVQGQVTGIVRLPKPTRGRRVADNVQWYVGAKSGEGEVYDAVIIATPWHNADITLLNTSERVKAKSFVHLHVTLLTTTRASPRPEYFGLGSQDVVPRTILTSDESVRRAQDKHKPVPEPEDPGTEPPSLSGKLKTPKHEFFSLNYLRSVERTAAKEEEYVVKIFSAAPVTDSMLDALFGKETLTWVRRHEWDSYPYLTPTERFPAVQIDEGLVYPNAMESLVSTMETSTIASRNAVALLLEKWYGAEFVHGSECSFDELKDPMDNPNWAGWGCDAA